MIDKFTLQHFYMFFQFSFFHNFLDLKIDELEAHIAWSRDTGLDLFSTTFSATLTSVKLTFLDNYSWTAIPGKIDDFCSRFIKYVLEWNLNCLINSSQIKQMKMLFNFKVI